MTEQNKTKVPAELIPAGDYPVVSTDAVMDKQKGKTQEEVNTEAGEKIAALEESVGSGGSVDTRIANAVNIEKTRAETKENQLLEIYQALDQSALEVLGENDALPNPGVARTIYRKYGGSSYTDYMYDSSDLITPIPLATYDNAIDDEPTPNSDNLVKSGGIANKYGFDINSQEYIKVITDGEGKLLFCIKTDGSIEWYKGIPIPIAEALSNKVTEEAGKSLIDDDYIQEVENNEYIKIIIDGDGKVLAGFKSDGSFDWAKGVPQHLQDYINNKHSNSMDRESLVAHVEGLGMRMPDVTLDANNNEELVTEGQRQCISIAKEMSLIKWKAKGSIKGCYSGTKANPKRKDFYSGSETLNTGIPYSSVSDRQVGYFVSVYTFMTAANNKYSLLYTEDTSSKSKFSSMPPTPHSAWGFQWTGGVSGGTYYGTVCSHFVSFASGDRCYELSSVGHRYFRNYTNEWIQSAYPNIRVDEDLQVVADIDSVRVGDIIAYWAASGGGHCRLVTGIERDADNKVTEMTITEALPNGNSDVQVHTYQRDVIIAYISGVGDDFDSEPGGIGNFFRSLNMSKCVHKPSPQWIAQEENEEYEYNNNICTFAGDKCVFPEGHLVVLNYNLNDDSFFETRWNGIRIYKYTQKYRKNGSVLEGVEEVLGSTSYNFKDFDTINLVNYGELDSSQINHALALGKNLEAGSYKACVFNGNEESEFTRFEIVGADISWSQDGDNITFNFDELRNVDEIIRIAVYDSNDNVYFFIEPTPDDNLNGKCTFNFVELNRIVFPSRPIDYNKKYLYNVIAKNKYGAKKIYFDNLTLRK